MTNPIDEAIRDFAVDQLEKEAKGEHTHLDNMPDEEFLAKEAHFYIRMANEGLNRRANISIAKAHLKATLILLEEKWD